MSATRILTVVDENDSVIGYKTKSEIDYSCDIYRVSALWVVSTNGDVLLAQRSLKHHHEPGVWGPAVAGTVEDETYQENIRKEAAEEIGLEGYDFQLGPKTFVEVIGRRYFCQWFIVTIPPEEINTLTLEDEEVAAVAWVAPDGLLKEAIDNPAKYIAGFEQMAGLFLNK